MTTYAPLRSIVVREGFNVRGVLPEIPKLAADVSERGVLEPITVRVIPPWILEGAEVKKVEQYEVVFGHRRHAALELLRKENRSALTRASEGEIGNGLIIGAHLRTVNDSFPVPIHVVDMTDEEACLANLAENAQKEDMRQVDVYARIDMLLKQGLPRDKVAAAAGMSLATLDKRMSTFRRLSPDVVNLWRAIERPEHEPAWNFLADVARGTTGPGKRGGDPATRNIPAPTSAQLRVWRTMFQEATGVVRLPEPAWRERHHLRPVREVKKKLAERKEKASDEFNEGVLCALEWVLGEDVTL